MQFKRNFSYNLQNLSIKRTEVFHPVPRGTTPLIVTMKIEKRTQHIEPLNSTPLNMVKNNFYSQNNASNKENIKSNGFGQEKSSKVTFGITKKDSINQKMNMSPILSFQRNNKSSNQKEDSLVRKNFAPHESSRESNMVNSNSSREIEFHRTQQRLREQSSFNHVLQSGSKNNVRLGSMVFNSLAKKEIKQKKFDVNSTGLRESKSYDRLNTMKTERNQVLDIKCMNNDGRQAKYKVIKFDREDEDILHYCSSCAIPLVRQGFPIEELTHDDIKRLNSRLPLMSKSDFYNSSSNQVKSARTSSNKQRPSHFNNEMIKMGEQIKCKVIMKMNKIKVGKEEFNKKIENNLENIDFYYNSLISHIQQQRLQDRQEILDVKNNSKDEPQRYESHLLNNLNELYSIIKSNRVNSEVIQQFKSLLGQQVLYPRVKINIEPVNGFQAKFDEFVQFFEQRAKLNVQENNPPSEAISYQPYSQEIHQRRQYVPQESRRNHPLRFSFQEALDKQNRKCYNASEMTEMNPLYEESQSDQQNLPIQSNSHNAFRNLFPEEDEDFNQRQKNSHSPVFKQF